MFRQIRGNVPVVEALSGMISSGKIPHAIMFHEDDGGGAFGIAVAFLQYLYCSDRLDGDSCGVCPSCNRISKLIHPDVHFIFPTIASQTSEAYLSKFRELALTNPSFTEAELGDALGIEGKSSLIAVSEAKALLDTLALSAMEGGYRSVLIYLPEKMNQEAANRLLKLIEEPPVLTQFLLITHDPEKVLRTVASRCQCIRVVPENMSGLQCGDSEGLYRDIFIRLMEALISGKLLEAIEVGEEAAALPSRESARLFCRYAAECFRQIFLEQQGMVSFSDNDGEVGTWAAKCHKTFPRLASEAVDRAAMLIVRNVNMKILFTDMVNKLYTLIWMRQ